MKFNRFVAAAATMMAVGASQATVTFPSGNLGTLTVFPEQFADVILALHPKSFTDNYTFSLGSTANVFGSVSELFGSITFTQVLIDGLDTGPLAPTWTGYGFDFGPVAAGVHTLTVKGTVLPGISAYQGSVYAITANIPEPTSVALLLGGLAVVGAVARKRAN